MNRRILTIIGIIAVVALLIVTVSAVSALIGNADAIGGWLQNANDPVVCSESATCQWLHPTLFGLIVVFVILTGFAYTTLLERRILAFLQQRVGPNRVGYKGVFQPLADAIKLIFKEDIIPDKADKVVYYLAPMLKAVPAIIVVAVIPFGPDIVFPGLGGEWYLIPLGLSDVNVGILYLLAITSLGTYGVVLAGWASNNKYAMLGGLRATSQMISYELVLGLSIAVPVMIAGSMSLGDIIDAQAYPWQWFVFQNPLAAGLLIIALFAEVSRAPFDLVEAEQELTAGFMTEYSGMKFAMFMMAEYIGMITISFIIVATFFGGYHLLPVDTVGLLGPLVMIGKTVFFLSIIIWVRGTLPRVRYDRLMALGWKVMLPLALVSVAWTAIAVVVRETSLTLYVISSLVFFLVVVGGGFFFLSGDQTEESDEDDWINDPLITGERQSAAWAGLNILGGLLAIPFKLVEGIINAIEGFGKAMDPTDETAITPVDQQQRQPGQGGD